MFYLSVIMIGKCLLSNSHFVERLLKYLSKDYSIMHSLTMSNTLLLHAWLRIILNFLSLSLFSSKSLKYLSLKVVSCRGKFNKSYITFTSMWELSALTTLHLDGIKLSDYNTDMSFLTLISKCENLKNLTVKNCEMMESNDFNFCHSQLSNLTIETTCFSLTSVSVAAPQLKNLSIRGYPKKIKIYASAPDLAYLFLQTDGSLNFSADDFRSLETVDICIFNPYKEDPQEIVGLLQCLHNVKYLTLNVEILEHLSSSVELMSHQPFPFANLKRLKIYPQRLYNWQLPDGKADVASVVKNYILDNSSSATFIMVSREEMLTNNNALSAKDRMDGLRKLLEKEKADIQTSMAYIEQENALMESHNEKMDEQQNTQAENQVQIEGNMAHMRSCWEGLSEPIEQCKKKIDDIIWNLLNIKNFLTKLPALKRAEMQPSFSSLCLEAEIVMSKITDCMKIQFAENQSRLNVGIHELATTLQSSS